MRAIDQGALVDDGDGAAAPRSIFHPRASCQASARGAARPTAVSARSARGNFGVRKEIDQDAVEQINVIGSEIRSPLQEQFGDPAGCLGAAFGIAVPDDLIESGDQ